MHDGAGGQDAVTASSLVADGIDPPRMAAPGIEASEVDDLIGPHLGIATKDDAARHPRRLAERDPGREAVVAPSDRTLTGYSDRPDRSSPAPAAA